MDRQSFIEDLRWCLHAPALLGIQPLPFTVDKGWQKGWQQALEQHLALAKQVDANPRLGLYFEQLWRSLIALHPDWQLLADNVAVQQDGRTQGAIDFLLLNHSQQQIEHWELAVKFYLAAQLSPQSEHYLGPNQQDRLNNKLSKLLLKQLPLGRHPQIQKLRSPYPNYTFKQRILLPGYLFKLADPKHTQPQDLHWYDLQHWQHMQQSQWKRLTKQQWLNPAAYHLSDCEKALDLSKGPIQLYLPKNGQQPAKRVFICPNDWLVRANAKLHSR
ncbi:MULTISPECIES: DUF1853 family protein [unclassified Agarivorans]|uniref:DUF1853 family protein n=1 Tax=unclassified Agarivorans TaxID=2636026 RepID=UPI0026E1BECC|nr:MULTISPECIES: DUF1853 family protein [unclassified Agarivorans]MDO6686446.1 DUF1853 family protein [Agarivorans sp. 3_MG-2023]MDO6713748.1 DUF1853 family protein [Agarivorans sp. 2_MG-2023]